MHTSLDCSARTWLVITMTIALLGPGCGVTQNAAYCDEQTPCPSPDAPYCHTDTNRCSDVPVGEPCDEAGQCSNPDRPVCLVGVCVECESANDCSAEAPVCDPQTLACQDCSSDSDCAMYSDTPVCEAGMCVGCRLDSDCTEELAPVCDPERSTCRSCEADSECASSLCEVEMGSCADPAEILYVANSGTDDGECTLDGPCKTVSRALELVTSDRNQILLEAGNYIENLSIAADVSIRGRDAVIYGDAANTPVVHIAGGITVHIRDLTIRSGTGTSSAHGIECESSTVDLDMVTVLGNAGDGIHLNECDLTMLDSLVADNAGGAGLSSIAGTITVTASSVEDNQTGLILEDNNAELRELTVSGNSGPGITADNANVSIAASYIGNNSGLGLVADAGATLVIRRSTVFKNRGGGIRGRDAQLTVTNNVIARNGRPFSQFPSPNGPSGEGGLRLLEGIHPTSVSGQFEHNTIADNYADKSHGTAGIICEGAVAVPMRNNLIAHNTVDPPNLAPDIPPTYDQVAGDCSHSYTLAFPKAPPGEMNFASAPEFVDRPQSDYHLTMTSPGVDQGTGSDLQQDVDGEERPQGVAADVGADEVR